MAIGSIALEHEQREDAALAGATQLERLPVGQHRDVPEETELELHGGTRASWRSVPPRQSSVKTCGSGSGWRRRDSISRDAVPSRASARFAFARLLPICG